MMPFTSIIKSYRSIILSIISGYLLVFIGIAFVGQQVINDISSIDAITHKLFQHPFQVNGAAREARHQASLIRIELLNALAVRSQNGHPLLLKRINTHSASIDTNLGVIEANFLGDMSHVTDIKKSNAVWQKARAKLIALLEQGHYNEAEKYMLATSGATYAALAHKLDYIVDYSSNKAVFFADKSKQKAATAHHIFSLLLISLAFIALIAASLTIMLVARQLHKRDQQLALARARFRIMFESAPIPLLLVNHADEIVQYNSAIQKHFGYNQDELLGKPVGVLVPERHRGDHGDNTIYSYFKTNLSGEIASDNDVFGLSKDGHEFPIEVRLDRIEADGVNFVLAAINNISERKQLENALIQERDKAKAASKTKSGFLANMSHEIRTPMNAIIGLTQLVLDSKLSEQQRDYLTKVHRSSRALLDILNDILDYSKIEAGHLQLEHVEFNLEDEFKRMGDLFMARIDEKGLEMVFEYDPAIPEHLLGDPLRLSQVLNNLVSNAIKFTEHGTIFIKANAIRQTKNEIQMGFSVRDSGMGIAEDQQKNLFQAFTQADSSITRNFGGTGLGLTISKDLVELMGGEISVVSKIGEGSEFTFTARFGICLDAADKAVAHDQPSLHGMRVLVVDDQETSRTVLRGYLESWKFVVTTASSGLEALAIIEQAEKDAQPFDLLILDWKMPGMDGLQLAQTVDKKHEVDQHQPIMIMATGFTLDELKAEQNTSILDAVLLKPIMPSPLFDTIINIKCADKKRSGAHSLVDNGIGLRQANRDIRGASLLLVEDNDINQEVARELLVRAGLRVTIANHGEEALSLMKCESFDAILMDIHMPVMDGLEASREIRKLPEGKDIPIIALSAAAMKQDKEDAIESGMNAHLTKPIDPDELLSMLEAWIQPDHRETVVQGTMADDDSTLPHQLAGFDLDSAIERLGGNQSLLAKLLRRFANDYDSTPKELSILLSNKQFIEASELVHRLAGAAANLGADKLALVARELISELKCGNETVSTQAFEASLASAIRAIHEHIKTPELNVEQSSISDLTKIISKLTRLSGKLEEYDAISSVEVSELCAQLAEYIPQSSLLKLAEQIESYDYSEAIATISTVLTSLQNKQEDK